MKAIKLHDSDNCATALENIAKDETILIGDKPIVIAESISQKHKFTTEFIAKGGDVKMYGIIIGMAIESLAKGTLIHTKNVKHATEAEQRVDIAPKWKVPNISAFEEKYFQGYHRKDGLVGTQNIWLVIPLVFCENRNIKIMEEAFLEELGFTKPNTYKFLVRRLKTNQISAEIKDDSSPWEAKNNYHKEDHRFFKNIDGLKFLTHQGGCGGTREDSLSLCRLIAGYIRNPNTAGATILSLGCQNAQMSILKDALNSEDNQCNKPVLYFEQQQMGTEEILLTKAITETFKELEKANKIERQPAPLSHLSIGLECGGSDGFSGISANPVVGRVSDLIVALGGNAILAEFPELCGVENQLISRMKDAKTAKKFKHLMTTYAEKAKAVGSGFDMNPSPGNIKDGLITDAMKSAGAAKKGGTAPISEVLDYTEQIQNQGLHLLCTPGNDVESTTGLAGSGSNIILFTTGLGTPTGNPIAPVVKISSNSSLAEQMSDIIDFDTGAVISGLSSIEELGDELLKLIIEVASGNVKTKAQQLNQDDFIPWKRGISL